MKYQLVLQWPVSNSDDYDTLLQMEQELLDNLPNDSNVDGHDMGTNEMNIFVLTNDPHKTFEATKEILDGSPLWPEIRVAFRSVETSRFTIVWPGDLQNFTVS